MNNLDEYSTTHINDKQQLPSPNLPPINVFLPNFPINDMIPTYLNPEDVTTDIEFSYNGSLNFTPAHSNFGNGIDEESSKNALSNAAAAAEEAKNRIRKQNNESKRKERNYNIKVQEYYIKNDKILKEFKDQIQTCPDLENLCLQLFNQLLPFPLNPRKQKISNKIVKNKNIKRVSKKVATSSKNLQQNDGITNEPLEHLRHHSLLTKNDQELSANIFSRKPLIIGGCQRHSKSISVPLEYRVMESPENMNSNLTPKESPLLPPTKLGKKILHSGRFIGENISRINNTPSWLDKYSSIERHIKIQRKIIELEHQLNPPQNEIKDDISSVQDSLSKLNLESKSVTNQNVDVANQGGY